MTVLMTTKSEGDPPKLLWFGNSKLSNQHFLVFYSSSTRAPDGRDRTSMPFMAARVGPRSFHTQPLMADHKRLTPEGHTARKGTRAKPPIIWPLTIKSN